MSEVVDRPTILTLKIRLKPSEKNSFSDWQADLNQKVANFPGFVSLETTLTHEKEQEWLIGQRFGSPDCLSSWETSPQYRALLEKLHTIADFNTISSPIQNGVTEIFVTSVNLENVKAYRDWTAKIHQAESKFPGFKGTFVQSPDNGSNNWITFLQFDTPEHLDKWIHSKERKELLEEGKNLIYTLDNHRMISPFSGWFKGLSLNNELPPAWKQGMIVLLVLFPVVMLEMKFLNPHLTHLNTSLAVFIGNSISVTLVTWPLVPLAIKLFSWWLQPEGNKQLLNMIGTLMMLALYSIEIALLWNLL